MLSTKDLKDLFGENSPDKVILKAQKLSAKGRNDQAVDVIKEAIGRLGEIPDLRVELATLHLASGRPREAAESLRALLKSDSSQVKRVEEYLGWARTQFSDTEALYEPMAEGHIARRNYSAAMECLERINRKSLESSLEARLANLNRFLEKGTLVPKSALSALYYAALSYEAINEGQKAVDTYRKILTASPPEFIQVDERLKALVGRNYKATSLRLSYAGLLDGLGHGARSQEEYLKALEVDPRCAPHVGKYLETRLASEPENDDLVWAMVRVHLASGKREEAIEASGRLADRKSHLSEIEKLLEEFAGSGKETVDTQLLLGKVALAQGKAQRAVAAIVAAMGDEAAGDRGLRALEQVIEAFPSEPRPYQILADCHLKAGRVDKCLEAYRALRRVDPGSGSIISARLTAVLAADPTNSAALGLLEEVCVESGDIKGAVPFLRRRLRQSAESSREVVTRLKAMMMTAPGDEGLRLAATEAHIAAGDPMTAWGHLQDLIDTSKPADGPQMRLLVLCAGASAEVFKKVAAHLGSRLGKWSDQPEVVFAMAESAGRAGLLREAVERFRKAASLAPETTAVCHAAVRQLAAAGTERRSGEERAILAEALLDAGDLVGATECLRGAGAMPPAVAARMVERFTSALKADPKNIALSTGLAEVCVASGQTARALEIARVGLTGREDAASAPLTLIYGDALVKAGKPAEATKAYAAAARRDSQLSHNVIERLQQVIQIDMGLETAHLTLGRLLINDGRVTDGVAALLTAWSIHAELGPTVLKDLDRTARKHSGDPAIDFGRSQILLETGDATAAAEALSGHIGGDTERLNEILTRLEAIAGRDPGCARAQVELGRAYLARRWAARACACFVRAHKLDATLSSLIAGPLAQIQKEFPDEPEAHLARGAIYEAEEKVLPAAEAYQKAATLGGVRGSGALEGLRRLCQAGREVPGSVHLMRARACRILGEVQEAVLATRAALDSAGDTASPVRLELDQLVESNPASSVARLGRAAACLKLQEHDAAASDLAEALRLDPASSDSVIALARQILERRPSFAPAARALANALLATGDKAGAARAIDMALATPEAGSDLELILARREMALQAGDRETAAAMLSRAESSATDRDAFLERLHREVIRQVSAESLDGGVVERLIARGDYLRALESLAGEPSSPKKAWALDRCGRYLEAAACLGELTTDDRAASSYASLLDRMVSRELEGRAVCLMGETTLEFERLATVDRTPARPRKAGQAGISGHAVQGGRQ